MAVNLWPNADLETDVADWNNDYGCAVAQSSAQKWEQTYSLLCPFIAWGRAKTDNKAIVSASTQYTLSFYLYVATTHNFATYILDQDDNEIDSDYGNSYTGAGWTRFTGTFTTGAGDTGIKVRIDDNEGSGIDAYVDGIMLETGSSASTWVNYVEPSVDVVQDPAGAIVAFGYNPTVTATDAAVDVVQDPVGAIVATGYDPTVTALSPTVTVDQVPAGAVVATGYNPVVTVAGGLWEIGPYIYSTVGGVQVIQSPSGGATIQGYDPVVTGESVPADIEQVPAGSIWASGFNHTVTATAAAVDVVQDPVGEITATGYDPTVTATHTPAGAWPTGEGMVVLLRRIRRRRHA